MDGEVGGQLNFQVNIVRLFVVSPGLKDLFLLHKLDDEDVVLDC